jgi:hypothetical protein
MANQLVYYGIYNSLRRGIEQRSGDALYWRSEVNNVNDRVITGMLG